MWYWIQWIIKTHAEAKVGLEWCLSLSFDVHMKKNTNICLMHQLVSTETDISSPFFVWFLFRNTVTYRWDFRSVPVVILCFSVQIGAHIHILMPLRSWSVRDVAVTLCGTLHNSKVIVFHLWLVFHEERLQGFWNQDDQSIDLFWIY